MTTKIYGDSFYTVVPGPSWKDADQNAKDLGGVLVTINNIKENQFLT